MSELLRRTDFRVKLNFIDLNQIPIKMGDVKLTFYTAAPSDYYTIDYKGVNTPLCQLQDDGLICVVSKHCFVSQNLMLKCQYDIVSDKYPDGHKRVIEIIDTKIKIIDSYSTPSAAAIVPISAANNEDGIAVAISIIYEAIKGDAGKDAELPIIDYCDLSEIELENTFWPNANGGKQQLYRRTFIVDYPNGYVPNDFNMVFSTSPIGLSGIECTSIEGYRQELTAPNYHSVMISQVLQAKVFGGAWGNIFTLCGVAFQGPCKLVFTINYYKI